MVNDVDDAAMKSRYASFGIKFDKEAWVEWATNEGIDERCIAFMDKQADEIFQESNQYSAEAEGINPRSMVNFFSLISTLDNFEKDFPMVQVMGEATIGGTVVNLFQAFIKMGLDRLPSLEEMLNQPLPTVKASLISVLNKNGNYDGAVGSILCNRLRFGILKKVESKSADDKLRARIKDLLTDPDIFSNDVAYVALRALVNSGKPSLVELAKDNDIRTTVLS